jgi:hypothetical protein
MLLLAALSIQKALHRNELDLAVFDPSQSLGTKNQEACFTLGIGGNNDALSHHWRFGWGVVGTTLQSPYSYPLYLDHRVRNRRNGRRPEGNYPHHIGNCGADSDRICLRSCCSFLRWSVFE